MKQTTNSIIMIIGLLLIIIQVFVLDHNISNGVITIPQYVNFATFIYDLIYWFGYCFVGIIGLVMTVIGAIFMNKSDKK